MKNVLRIVVAALVAAPFVAFFGCSSEEETPAPTPPTLEIAATLASTQAAISSGDEVLPGDTVYLDFLVNAPGGFNVIRVQRDGVQVEEVDRDDLGIPAGTVSPTIPQFTIPVLESAANSTSTYSVSVVDEGNLSVTADFELVVPSPTAKRVTTVMVYAPTLDLNSKTFYGVTENMTYSRNDIENTAEAISPSIDFGYYYSTTDNASIYAPASYPSDIYDLDAAGWGTIHSTELALANGVDFDGLETVADVNAAIDAITFDGGAVTDLAVGDIVAFKVDPDQLTGQPREFGFFKVTTINGTFNADDNIELELVINQAE